MVWMPHLLILPADSWKSLSFWSLILISSNIPFLEEPISYFWDPTSIKILILLIEHFNLFLQASVQIGRTFGGKYLLTLYVAGAVGGSLGHLLYYTYIYPRLQVIHIFAVNSHDKWFFWSLIFILHLLWQKTPRYFYNPRYSPTALVW